MKLLIALCVGFMVLECNAQTNVYNCAIVDVPTQAEIDATILYSDQCILFDAPTIYSFGQTDNNTVKASSRIDVEPGFTSEDYTLGAGMTLILCDDNRNVASFSHTDLSNVEALKKFEFGIELPENVNALVQEFITSGDTMNGEINPYLDWHLNAIATFTHKETGFKKIVYGFYFQDFERNTTSTNTANWGWNQLPTSHPIRFRYAPSEREGRWDISIRVELQDGNTIHYCPFAIGVTSNTSDDGYVKVAANNRVLERNGKLFFPIGQNLPWPEDQYLDANGNVTDDYGVEAGAWGPNPVNCRAHKEYIEKMEAFAAEGGKSVRFLLNPVSLDIEFEKVGDYTDRLSYGWELDNIIEKAEELDLYLHFNLLVHMGLQVNNEWRLNWDWNKAPHPSSSVNTRNFAYRDFFGTQDNTPELFFDNAECIKYYKQKTRYLISRYGYSPHISMLELLSESNTAGERKEYVEVENGHKLELEFSPYLQDAAQPARLAAWHQTMAKYIKEELGHTEHILTVSYAGSGIDHATDFSYAIPEIDVITWNQYSSSPIKYFNSAETVAKFWAYYQKPILWSETGPVVEMPCGGDPIYRKDTWMSAFTGIAGFNQWSGFYTPHLWHHLLTTQNFIENDPDISAMLMGNDWQSKNLGDQGYYEANGIFYSLPSEQKECNYLVGTYQNQNGTTKNLMVGAVSNLTENYYSCRYDPSDITSWCATNFVPQPLENKFDLTSNNHQLILNHGDPSMYGFNWFDENGFFHSSTNQVSSGFLTLPHPTSCITTSCPVQLAEIPFVGTWTGLQGMAKTITSVRDEQLNESVDEDTTQRLDSDEQFKLVVSPNSGQNTIQIACTDESITTFELRDSKGSLIRIILETGEVDISNLDPGIFVILGKDHQNTIKYQQRWLKL